MDAGMDFKEAEELLLASRFEDCRQLWYSSNYVFLAQMCGPTGEPFAAVYKPQRGESPLWDFESGSLYKREVAAYRLSQLLGWRFIPPTVIREGPHGIGALQVYIQHDQTSHFFEQRDVPDLVPQLQRIAVFDYVANNADRKGGHCLLDSEGRIWGIDHGLCFHHQFKMRTVMWDWADKEVPSEWLGELETAGKLIEANDELARPLLELVEPEEQLAILVRIERLLQTRAFPRPGPHRSYPWPLV
jgi:uncharacterized repeat protein (TIGR03843 family)